MPNAVLMHLLLALACAAQAGEARPLIHPLFSDHAVVQRDRPLPVWGWDVPGTRVVVNLGAAKAEAVADASGRWLAHVPAQPSGGGPQELTVVGTRRETRSDLLLGDVWLCSGQSNMGFALKNSTGGAEAAAAAKGLDLRLITIARQAATTAKEVPAGGAWEVCTPENAANFSAVAYHFAKEMLPTTKAPIGLVLSSWFATSAEAWTSRDALLPLEDFTADLPPLDGPAPKDAKRFGDQGQNRPTMLFNGMIHPLMPAALRGVLWYQGENNGYADKAGQYRRLLPALIAGWREGFATPDLPFAIVQLANWKEQQTKPVDGGWAAAREAQALTARTVPGVGLVVTVGLGDAVDVHPKNKAEVGRRLALWARSTVFGEKDLAWSGPWYRSATVDGAAMRIAFDHAAGLRAADGAAITGFAIAGADKRWHFATATVAGADLLIRSDAVTAPVAVRYAWAMNPVCNLTNAAGLPAVPFRTDDWKN